jgi:hypothetical protein
VAAAGAAAGGGTARARRGREPESRDDGDPGRTATAGPSTSSVKASGHCLILSGTSLFPGWKISIAQHMYGDILMQYIYEKMQRHNLITEISRPGLSSFLLNSDISCAYLRKGNGNANEGFSERE